MANPVPPRPVTPDDQRIEAELRAFLSRLIQAIERWNALLGFAMILFIPLGVILAAIYLFHWSLWQTLLYGFLLWLGVMIVLLVLSTRDENRKLRRGAREFDERYPPASPERETAMGILREMESPQKVERKLLSVIMGGTPDYPPTENFILRRRPGTAEDEIAGQLGDLAGGDVPPAVLPAPHRPPTPPVEPFPTAGPPPGPPAGPGARAGGEHFDFIPLEPFTPPDPAAPPGKEHK